MADKFFNNKGFSLVGVMVAVGLLGAVSLGVMHLMKNIQQGQSFAKSSADEIELRTEIRMILDDDKFCKVSLAGEGPSGLPIPPVTFQKKNIDEPSEGIDVELWLSDFKGEKRTSKKFSAKDTAKSTYGRLKITSMKLIMNNQTGINYPESSWHTDIGEVRVKIEKSDEKRHINMVFPVVVGMSTNAGGETTIYSCHRERVSPVRVASGKDVVGPNDVSNQAIINLQDHGFDPLGSDPHFLVSERDSNYVHADGNTMDASYCGYTKLSKLKYQVVCWASPNNSDGSVQSTFDWIAIQN